MRGSTTGASRRPNGVRNELFDFAAPGNCWLSIMGLPAAAKLQEVSQPEMPVFRGLAKETREIRPTSVRFFVQMKTTDWELGISNRRRQRTFRHANISSIL